MKQNERLLIYAVTGFLALILLLAVVFGHNPPAEGAVGSPGGSQGSSAQGNPIGLPAAKGTGAMGLGEILGRANGGAAAAGANGAEPAPSTDQADANRTTTENQKTPPAGESLAAGGLAAGGQPLVAAGKTLIAAEVVTQSLGSSRRDRNVRFVRARSGDSLELLVRRWCGARDPFLAEAQSLNEDLVGLRVGQEVAVPYVDDEVLMATLEAPKPAAVVASAGASGANGAGAGSAKELGSLLGTRVPGSEPEARPSFAVPGSVATGNGAAVDGAAPAARGNVLEASAARGSSYTVKSGDSLWKIAERTYGRQLADRMIPAIKAANPGLTDTVRIGQKLVLPKPAQ
ncbi:MAG: LysM peptidoglycan-binding domain-containing protein [Planctomycetes bacterium]|jgi:nucleoid-associated protein YgaU|nr:LysM peptidoglycan-binding domain-containing protein [Planctomycetota bacterium]